MKAKLFYFVCCLFIFQTASKEVILDFIEYNSEIPWTDINKSNVESVILKIAEGLTIDKHFQTNFQNAQNANINICGVYFLSKSESENESIAEADFIIASLKGKKLPIYLDMETNNTSNLGIKEITKTMIAFTKRCATYEYECNIYTSKKGFFTYFYPGQLVELGSKLWVTSYGKNTEEMNTQYKPNVGEYLWRYYTQTVVDSENKIGYNMKYTFEISQPYVDMDIDRKIVKVIHPEGVPIRKKPVVDIYNIDRVVKYGNRIQITSKTEDKKWYIVSDGNYVTTDVKYVIDSNVVANKQPVLIREDPSEESDGEPTSAYFGTVFPVVEENEGWVRVKKLETILSPPQLYDGWISKNEVTFK